MTSFPSSLVWLATHKLVCKWECPIHESSSYKNPESRSAIPSPVSKASDPEVLVDDRDGGTSGAAQKHTLQLVGFSIMM